jgi:histidinol-phosphate aminotransferase
MKSSFPFDILRPDAPTKPSFTVSEVPHRAKLDQNESPVDMPEEVKRNFLDALHEEKWNRYPQPKRYDEVKERFAAAIGQPKERVIITAGGDQMILLAFLAAGGIGRRARIFEPTYPMYAAYARMTQTEVDGVVLGADFDIESRGLGDDVDLLMLVSPNNPTGNGPGRALVSEALKRECLVFLDEAYADYAGESALDLVENHPNLLVGRSLSKSLLAGVRLGFGVGHPELINVLERLIFAPYNLNALQMIVASRFEVLKPHIDATVSRAITERHRVYKELSALGIRAWPSKANFILFETRDAAAVYSGLLSRGVRIRNVSSMPGLKQHLRVTIGTTEQNDLFLEAVAGPV